MLHFFFHQLCVKNIQRFFVVKHASPLFLDLLSFPVQTVLMYSSLKDSLVSHF